MDIFMFSPVCPAPLLPGSVPEGTIQVDKNAVSDFPNRQEIAVAHYARA